MDVLFTATVIADGKNIRSYVIFENEAYLFQSADGKGNLFSLRRENDEWHTNDSIDEHTKTAAIEALETYLLSQH